MTTPTNSADLAPDEKRCPFCAETIKAAAIRCRFCQSDLPAPDDEAEVAPVPQTAPDPDPATTPELLLTAPEDDPAAPEPTATAGIRTLAALFVLCLVLGIILGFLVHRSRHPDLGAAPNGQVTQASFRNAAMGEASTAAELALSYSYKTFDADRKRARALMGSRLAKQYDEAMDTVSAQTATAKLTLKATVLSVGLLSAKEHEAKVLLFVNTVTTREGSTKQQLDQNRVLMDLTRKDGGWTVSKMDAF